MIFQDFSRGRPTTTSAKSQPWAKDVWIIIATLATGMMMDTIPPIHASNPPNDASQDQEPSETKGQDTESKPEVAQTAIPLNHQASQESAPDAKQDRAFGVGPGALAGMLS